MNEKIFSVIAALFAFIIGTTIIYLAIGRKRVWGRFPLYPEEKILYEEENIKITVGPRGKYRKNIFYNSGFKISNERIFIMSGKSFVLQTIEYKKTGTDDIFRSEFFIPKENFKFEMNEQGEWILKIQKPISDTYTYNLEMPVRGINAVKKALGM